MQRVEAGSGWEGESPDDCESTSVVVRGSAEVCRGEEEPALWWNDRKAFQGSGYQRNVG